MRRDTNRRSNDNRETTLDTKKVSIAAGIGIGVLVIAFVIIYSIYQANMNKQIASSKEKTQELINITNTDIRAEQASSSVGKTVNELQNEIKQETSTNIASNTTSNTTNQTNTTKNEDAKTDTQTQKENTNVEKNNNTDSGKKEETKQDPSFQMPVEGEIIKEFAKDKLVYSETLKEWITHNGIDIKADKTTVVKVSADGTVKSIKNDPRYGLTVTIEHDNGFITIYSNLLTAEFVTENEKVKQGQTIGTVGTSATFEIMDDPHLHFEIQKDNTPVDPSIYLK